MESQHTRRTLYLSIVRPTLGYVTQIWAQQSIELMRKVERVQRRATKFILRLPFFCPDSYQDHLARTSLLPICYWHDYLDLVFLFKALNGLIELDPDILPKPLVPSLLTRSISNRNALLFRPTKCKTLTFQRSYLSRITRIWNTLPEDLKLNTVDLSAFKYKLKLYYNQALSFFDPEIHGHDVPSAPHAT